MFDGMMVGVVRKEKKCECMKEQREREGESSNSEMGKGSTFSGVRETNREKETHCVH